MAGTRRLTELLDTARRDSTLPGGPLAVALSGGGDSAGLAAIVVTGAQPVRAVHVDHGLPHSPMMRSAAEEVASSLGLDLEVATVQVPPGASPEGQARAARYRAFEAALRPGETILTAHTADDNAETILLNLTRGTGLRGLAGIPSHRAPGIARPVLGLRRSLIREIATLSGLAFAEDPMNLDPGLSRNYVRLEVVPRLEALNPRLVEALTRMSAGLRADAELLDSLVDSIPVEVGDGWSRCPVGALTAASAPLAGRVVARMLSGLGVGVSAERVARVTSVLSGAATSAELGDGVSARRAGPFLEVSRTARIEPGPVPLDPGRHRVGRLHYEVVGRRDVCRVAPLGPWHAIFPSTARLEATPEGLVLADGRPAWEPGVRRLPHAWYEPGEVGYLSVFAREESGWTSGP
jgi:tRNA(Ile)-lysidine synthase